MSLYICLFRHLCNRMMQFSQVALVKYHASIHFVACPMITKRSNLYKLLLFVILRDCQPRIPPPSKFERTQISPPEPRTFALSPLGGAQKFRSNPHDYRMTLQSASYLRRSVVSFVLPEGFEPPTTGSKPVMISISPRELCLYI